MFNVEQKLPTALFGTKSINLTNEITSHIFCFLPVKECNTKGNACLATLALYWSLVVYKGCSFCNTGFFFFAYTSLLPDTLKLGNS